MSDGDEEISDEENGEEEDGEDEDGEMVDGINVVREHSGDFSGLASKSSNLYSYEKFARLRWRDVIYGDAGLFKEN